MSWNAAEIEVAAREDDYMSRLLGKLPTWLSNLVRGFGTLKVGKSGLWGFHN